MTLIEIKKAVNNGQKVCWKNSRYIVIRDSIGQYLIYCTDNGDCVGLHGKTGTKYANTLNGQECDFYIEE